MGIIIDGSVAIGVGPAGSIAVKSEIKNKS
jgi:hypothetical protein